MRLYFIGIVFSSICIMTACNGNHGSDENKINSLIDRYVESINTCDTSIVEEIWSKKDNVSFIAPSGYYGSYSEIKDGLILGVFDANFIERHLQKESVKVTVNRESAWSEFTWTFRAIKRDSSIVNSKGRETQIFEKDENGIWKLVHIHYSPIK